MTAVLSGWSLYFVENAVGQLNVTTVFAQEASPKKLKAVHSRHGYLQMQVGKLHRRAVGLAELRRVRDGVKRAPPPDPQKSRFVSRRISSTAVRSAAVRLA